MKWFHAMAAAALCGVLACCAEAPRVSDMLPMTPTDQAAIPVSLKFENVRTFLDAEGRESSDEWAQITPILRKHHSVGNVYGLEYRVDSTPRPNPPPGMRVSDYTVQMVVPSMTKLSDLHNEIAATRGKTVGGQRIDFAASRVEISYSTPYVKPEMELSFFGKAEAGAKLFLYEPGMTTPRQETVGAAGRWIVRLRVDPRVDHVYGYTVGADGAARYFRINVFTRAEEDLTRDAFERLRQAGG